MNTIKGDLLRLAKEGRFDVIVHGCNCQRTMGAGIAKQIARELPEVAFTDRVTSKNKGGEVDIVDLKDYDFKVINAYTQIHWGRSKPMSGFDSQEDRYRYIKKCMTAINVKFKSKRIGLPLIGCGLAGGDWKIVEKIVENTLVDCDVTIVEYKKGN